MGIDFQSRVGHRPVEFAANGAKMGATTTGLLALTYVLAGRAASLKEAATWGLGIGVAIVCLRLTIPESRVALREQNHNKSKVPLTGLLKSKFNKWLLTYPILLVMLKYSPINFRRSFWVGSRLTGFCFGVKASAMLQPVFLIWTDPKKDNEESKQPFETRVKNFVDQPDITQVLREFVEKCLTEYGRSLLNDSQELPDNETMGTMMGEAAMKSAPFLGWSLLKKPQFHRFGYWLVWWVLYGDSSKGTEDPGPSSCHTSPGSIQTVGKVIRDRLLEINTDIQNGDKAARLKNLCDVHTSLGVNSQIDAATSRKLKVGARLGVFLEEPQFDKEKQLQQLAIHFAKLTGQPCSIDGMAPNQVMHQIKENYKKKAMDHPDKTGNGDCNTFQAAVGCYKIIKIFYINELQEKHGPLAEPSSNGLADID